MSSDFWISTIKFSLSVLTGVLGILGVMNIFKSPSNKLTFWGKLAIWIIILSTLASFFIGYLDGKKSDEEQKELISSNKNLIREIEKSKHPIGDVSLMSWSELPDDDKEVINFKKDIEKYIAKTHGQSGDLFTFKKNKAISSNSSYKGSPLNYEVQVGSPYLSVKKFPILNSLLSTYSLGICIKADAIDPKKFYVVHGRFDTYDWCAFDMIPQENTLSYDVRTKKVNIITSIKYNKIFFSTNGRITSTIDLYGSQLFLVSSSGVDINKETLKALDIPDDQISKMLLVGSLKKNTYIRTVIMSFSNGQKINISGEYFKKYVSLQGGIFDYITLPKTDKEIEKLRSTF
ncbi:hypothetical protein [Rahnella sp. PAMC 25559]|uniref:hypothetical protein n=1 Tax=Rahnella sp. PAMC 25559 TaxID=3423225 RepID=UPI003D674D20